MEGASNLVGLDLHLTKEKMRELFAPWKRRSAFWTARPVLEQPAGELAVQCGSGEMHPSMGELSLIGLPVLLPNASPR